MAKSPIKLKVASPCSESWSEMKGDDAMRHCGACNQKVYQLSNMSSEQVEEFLLSRKTRGIRTCVRFYQRADGTMLTNDCSVGKKRKRKKQVISAFGAVAVSASAVGIGMRAQSDVAPTHEEVVPVVIEQELIMGEEIAMPDVPPVPEVVPEPQEVMQGGIGEPTYEMLGEVKYIPPAEQDE
jgi:hypothetical protein